MGRMNYLTNKDIVPKQTNKGIIYLKVILQEYVVTTKTGKKFQRNVCLDKEGNELIFQTWENDIPKIEAGKSYEIRNCYAHEYEDELIITIGMNGEMRE